MHMRYFYSSCILVFYEYPCCDMCFSLEITSTKTLFIDLGNHKSSVATVVEELEKLRSALSSWGCFQAINHGMTSSFLDKVHEVTMQFFSLPMDEKRKYSREANNIELIFSSHHFLFFFFLLRILSHQILDWTDRLILMLNPEDLRKFTFWPDNPTDFRGASPPRPPNQPILQSSRCESQSLPMHHALDQDVKCM
uniref:Non-haem dioxygenase N-terminal domain-containing protein n=1 Tax=Quercus lobata TaxID=97700 RepID=A0A7N2R039_QUELO